MLQLKLGAAAAAAAVGFYSYNVMRLRSVLPQGRRRKFTPGSADDLQADGVRPGDVVLFDRDPTTYLPLGAAWIALQKRVMPSDFDHVGLVVQVKGDAMILEDTFSGTRLRPFDERIVCSKAKQVVSRQLVQPLTDPQRRLLELEAVRLAAADRSSMAPAAMAARLLAGLWSGGVHGAERELYRGSVGVVEECLQAAGVGALEGRLHPAGLVRVAVPAPGVHLGPRVWWRDLK